MMIIYSINRGTIIRKGKEKEEIYKKKRKNKKNKTKGEINNFVGSSHIQIKDQ